MQLSLWGIIGMSAAMVNDVVAVAAVVSSGLILLASFLGLFTDQRPRRVFHLWEAALLAILFGGVGFVAKILDASLPSGLIFGFSHLTIGLLLFGAVLMLVAAVALSRLRNALR